MTFPYTPSKSGFFDIEPLVVECLDPAHNTPNMLVIPSGKGYRHVCPTCGQIQTTVGSRISLHAIGVTKNFSKNQHMDRRGGPAIWFGTPDEDLVIYSAKVIP